MIHVCAVCRARGLCVSFTVCVCVSLSRTRPTVAREACLRVGGECGPVAHLFHGSTPH